MRRREFIAGLGGVAAWPVAAQAQQPAIPIVGCLMNLSQGEADYNPARASESDQRS
jgi:hypothetical protein